VPALLQRVAAWRPGDAPVGLIKVGACSSLRPNFPLGQAHQPRGAWGQWLEALRHSEPKPRLDQGPPDQACKGPRTPATHWSDP